MPGTEIRLFGAGNADAIAAHRARGADARCEPSRRVGSCTPDGQREQIEQLPGDHRNGDGGPASSSSAAP